jgi:hypothetical protein
MKPIRVPAPDPEQLAELEGLYRTTREARLRTRAQMVLLAAERRMTAAEIAEIVRASEETVRRWLKRYLAEGTEGLRDPWWRDPTGRVRRGALPPTKMCQRTRGPYLWPGGSSTRIA